MVIGMTLVVDGMETSYIFISRFSLKLFENGGSQLNTVYCVLLKCSGHLESQAGRCLLEEQFPMVGLVHWHFFSFFVMESGSANLQIQLAQMRCEFKCVLRVCEFLRLSNDEYKRGQSIIYCSQVFRNGKRCEVKKQVLGLIESLI